MASASAAAAAAAAAAASAAAAAHQATAKAKADQGFNYDYLLESHVSDEDLQKDAADLKRRVPQPSVMLRWRFELYVGQRDGVAQPSVWQTTKRPSQLLMIPVTTHTHTHTHTGMSGCQIPRPTACRSRRQCTSTNHATLAPLRTESCHSAISLNRPRESSRYPTWLTILFCCVEHTPF
jgi:hypothetical protein